MAEVRTEEFLINVARGNVEGASIVHKFGANANIGTTISPITSSGTYQTPATAEVLELLSSDAGDTAVGIGARTVKVSGIGSDWGLQEEVVTLDGITPVVLTKSFRRVFRVRVETSGTYASASAGSHLGSITLRGSGGGVIWAIIDFDLALPLASSEIGAYTIPAGYEGLILHRELDIEASKLCHILFFVRDKADNVTDDFSPMRVLAVRRDITGLHLDGSPTGTSELLTGPCDVGFMAGTSAGSAQVEGAFKLLLLKK